MTSKFLTAVAGAVLAGSSVAALAQGAPRVYDLGPVVEVTHVKTEPGQLDAYLANLNSLWRPSLEDQKRRGEVLDYKVLRNMAPGRDEGDLILVVTYRNAAVLDTPLDEMDRRTVARQGSVAAAQQATIQRGKLRTILGTSLYREMPFKGQ
jgi:hypothetical protein